MNMSLEVPSQGAVHALGVLAAQSIRAAAQALLRSLHEAGWHADAVAWRDGSQAMLESLQPLTAMQVQAVSDALKASAPGAATAQAQAGAGEGAPGAPRHGLQVQVLHADASGPQAVLLWSSAGPAPGACGGLDVQPLLALAGRRLGELLAMAQLQAAVRHLEQAEQLQNALFAIADLAASVRDMGSMLRGLHQIIGRLMYARNFFIALYDEPRQSVRFIYFADEKDGGMYDPEEDLPVSLLEDSFTLAIIRQARTVRGPASEVARQLGIVRGPVLGTPSVDFMGVPMRRDQQVLGALAVQSYRAGLGYTEADCALLGFVAEHVLNAVERKHGQQALEQRVADRTRELALANVQLQEQIAQRERAAHLQATLYRIAAMANHPQSDADFYRSVHAAVGELINAENFYIALVSQDGSMLQFPYSVDGAGEAGVSRPLGRGVSEHVIGLGRTLLLDAAELQQLLARGEIELQQHTEGTSTVCWLGAPLLGPQGVMGVVAVQSYRADLLYHQQDADLLTFVSHQIASSVHRRQQEDALLALNSELEQRVQQRTHELRQEIAAREQVQEQLKHQVMHDPLTGLPNRVYLRDRLQRALAVRRRAPQQGFALLYLDVDRFKLFNDSLGHGVGDVVLCEVARRLSECVRGPDLVARLSGDEFAILVEHVEQPATACKVARRIQERMQASATVAERDLQISVSIGIAVGHERHRSIDDILHEADVALYRAKAAGRQRFMLFDAAGQAAAMDVLDMEQQLRRALHDGQFEAHFQPIVRLADGAVAGYEALIRWRHPERGMLAPGAFLPVAEQTGLMEAIDWHMYRLACTDGVALVRPGQFLTLNVSPRHFMNPEFEPMLLALLDATGFKPQQLHIEVTESTLLGDPEAVAAILQRLQHAGIGTALDDFGTGYSSLGHVHRFALCMIKIDRSFISGLGQASQARSSAIIDAVLSLGRALQLDIVAEGVETEAQRQTLMAMGCVHAQGFLFGRPAPARHWLGR